MAGAALALGNASCAPQVIDVYVSLDADGTRKAESPGPGQFITFPANTRGVYCIAEYSNGRENATVIGTMHQQSIEAIDGSTTPLNRDIIVASLNEPAKTGAQQIASMGLIPLDAEGKEDEKAPLSGGVYLCEFALRTSAVPEGTVAAVPDENKVQFRIEPSSCPPTRILQAQDCRIYPEGRACPMDGALSTTQSIEFQCTCTSGAWQCPTTSF